MPDCAIPVRTAAHRRAFAAVARPAPWVRPPPVPTPADAALFVVQRGGRVVGRIAAHRCRRYAALHGDAGLFGFFDADDLDAARALIDAAQAFHGPRTLVGPLSYTATQEMGLLTAGEEHAPGFTMAHNPPRYADYLVACGFRPCLHLQTSFGELRVDPRSLIGERQRAALAGVEVRTSSRRGLPADLEAVRDVMTTAFLDTPHFVPPTPTEWAAQMSPGLPYLDPNLLLLAEAGGVPVAALFALPDFNRVLAGAGRTDTAVILVAAVHPAYQGRGLGRGLYAGLLHTLRSRGYAAAYGSWIVEGNAANQRLVEAIGLRPCHRLAVFERPGRGGGDIQWG